MVEVLHLQMVSKPEELIFLLEGVIYYVSVPCIINCVHIKPFVSFKFSLSASLCFFYLF